MIKTKGAAVLLITLFLFTMALLALVYFARFSALETKVALNQYMNAHSFHAAEAGSQYGLAYIQTNSSTIVGSASAGSINYSLGTTTLANNATFNVTYTNPTVNNYDLLLIQSTGTSSDGTATRTVQEQIYSSSSTLPATLTTQGSVTMSGSGTIAGTVGIDAGGSVIKSGTWTISSTTQNDSNLSSETGTQFFTNIFGMSPTAMQAQSTVYNNPSTVPWGSLSGNVWINGTVVSSGTITVGSPSNPVLLMVNGGFIGSGTMTVYGILFTTGSITTSGNFNLYGGMASEGPITMSGTTLTYNSTIVKTLTGASGYAAVTGSWKDF